jgi:hypothetical protein
MNLRLKKALAIAAMPLAGAGLVVGLMTAGPAYAGDMPGTVANPSATPAPLASQAASVAASTKTVPWCGWTVSGLPTGLTLEDTAAKSAGKASSYKGVDIALGGSTSGVSAFVSGSTTASTDADNCSWYGDTNKQGLTMTVTASRANFTARPAGESADDAGMGFSLTSSSKLTITPAYTGCSDAFVTSNNLSVWADQLASTPVTASDKSLVTTTSACTWGLTYAAKIPGGMKPLFGDKTYAFTGPTLTTTVNIN